MSGAYITGAKQYPATKLGSSRRRARKVKEKLTWRQRLRNWFNQDLEDDLESIAGQALELGNGLSSDGMRFHLYRANGGYVVETRNYSEKHDQPYHKLYIINDEQDVGYEISKIITMENLR